MAADVVDEEGRPVRGRVGELVVRKPWPGMTRGFWRDPERYRETYWNRWPGVWVHGDWALIDEDGFWFIQGRSDDTIMVAGKRVGPAEVESVLVSHPAVGEAAAIGIPHEVKGQSIVGFVALRPGHQPGEDLRQSLVDLVVSQMGRALRPEAIRFVTQLPRTRNAKILRRLVKRVYLGERELGDTSALENPEAVEAIRQSS
jgi:acetyl-CoA synthetase